MSPEILDSLWAIAFWFAVVLVLPKRDLSSLPARISAVASGQRVHSTSPPGPVQSEDGSFSRFVPLLRAEVPRVLEQGVPVWLVSVMAEVLGTARRQEVRARWDRTPAGLLAAHLRGELSRRELHKRLAELGQPLPPSKAQRAVRRSYTVPPMAWLRELQPASKPIGNGPVPAPMLDGTHEEAPTSGEAPSATSVVEAEPKLEVQILGTLRVSFIDKDLTAKLLRRPTVAFVWQCALVRAVCTPDHPATREWLANVLYTGFDGETRRTRLRKQIYNMQQVLQGPLIQPIKMEGDGDIVFDLDSCSVDAVRILELAERVEGDQGLLAPMAAAEVSTALDATSGDVLSDWEDLEQLVAGGRGSAGQAVHELRSRIQGARVTLLAALADHYVALRDPARAAGLFEEGLALRPERPDLATKLASALDSSGQQKRAYEIRRSYLGRG